MKNCVDMEKRANIAFLLSGILVFSMIFIGCSNQTYQSSSQTSTSGSNNDEYQEQGQTPGSELNQVASNQDIIAEIDKTLIADDDVVEIGEMI